MIWFEELDILTFTIEYWNGSWQFELKIYDVNGDVLYAVGKFLYHDCINAAHTWMHDHENVISLYKAMWNV